MAKLSEADACLRMDGIGEVSRRLVNTTLLSPNQDTPFGQDQLDITRLRLKTWYATQNA